MLGLDAEKSIRINGPVICDFFVYLAVWELIVKGSVSVDVELMCVRCNIFFSTNARNDAFLRSYAITRSTESVDMTEDIREAALLLLPNFPLCGNDCKGLCPQCGCNLNTQTCSCQPRDFGGTWDELDKIHI